MTDLNVVNRLIELASPALMSHRFDIEKFPLNLHKVAKKLEPLLKAKNGFYAFASALHVYGVSESQAAGILGWNSPRGWRAEFGKLADGCFSFAEDIFGNQFCIDGNGFCQFNIETGETQRMGKNAEDWAELVLSDYGYWTGFNLGWEWQQIYGPLPIGKRLFPRQLFSLGGEFEVSNLWAGDITDSVGYYGLIAKHLAQLPEGSYVEIALPTGKIVSGVLNR